MRTYLHYLKLKQLHADVEKALADYEFNALIQTLYQFFWNEYRDRFLEAVKGDLKDGADPAAQAATLTTMDTVLRHYLALHPVMPHITEELWASWACGKQRRPAAHAHSSPSAETSWQDLMKAASPWRIPSRSPL
ncbi:MAG: class I tRNA ligase family protein [Akkermansia sp.]